jgi:hypothetical protein
MWCWRRMLRVSWIERRTNESIPSEIDEGKEILILRHENQLTYRIIEGKIEGNRDRGRPRTSFIKQMISYAGLSSYTELKRLAEKRKEWSVQVQLQNHLKG